MEDVVKYYRYIDVCKLKDHWHDLRLADSFSGRIPSVISSPVLVATAATPLTPVPSVPLPLSLSSSDSGSGSQSQLNRLPFTCGAIYSLTVPNSTQIFITLVQVCH
jgi:hypothetical protein